MYRKKWEDAAIKRKKSVKLRCGSRGGKAQNFAKDERGDSNGVPPESGAEKSQKTVTEKSADAAQADTMTFWEALSESEAGIEVIGAVSSAV